MRTVSFVENLEFKYNGNLFSKAMTLGDVDNDTGCELVVGNVLGELLIFKGHHSSPWRKATDLGMVTCVGIGDVCNKGMNFLVSLSADGWCYVFSVHPDSPGVKEVEEGVAEERILRPIHKQHLAANNKSLLIADTDGDGLHELVIAYTDRRVRSYRWTETVDMLEGGSPLSGKGRFVLLDEWTLAGQVGCVTINKKKDNSVDLMASQPGGTFVTLLPSQSKVKAATEGQIHEIQSEVTDPTEKVSKGPSLVYHPLGSARARNPGVTTEIVANISRRKKQDTYVPNYCAICTLDGTITLVDVDGKILWSLYVDHQLFTLAKLDITGDGREEVIACSWDGHTYLVNLNKDSARFHFDENVAAFCAGYYAVSGKQNVPCLVYATFSHKIRVYYNIRLSQIQTTHLLESMEKQEGIQDLLTHFNCDASNPHQLRKLYHWALYGYQPKPP